MVACLILGIVLIARIGGTILVPSIPAMACEFGIDNARATMNINLYAFVLAISFVIFGPITDRVGSRTLLLAGALLCAVSHLICSVAANILMFDIGRIMLAAGSSLIIITSQTWIGNRSGKEELLGRLAWFAMLVSLAPMLAPVLGGYITDHFAWRWNFRLMLILSFVVVGILTVVKGRRNEPPPVRDASLSLLALLRTYKDIILNTPILAISFMVFTLFMLQGAFMAFSSFLIIEELGCSAVQYGYVSLSLVGGLFLGRLPTLYFAKMFCIRTVVLINGSLVLVALVGSLICNALGWPHTVVEIVGVMTLICFGFSGLSVLGVRNSMLIDPERKGVITGLYSFLTQMTGWFGILLTQVCFHFGLTSISIYNHFLGLAIALLVIGISLFCKVYPRVRVVLG